MMQLFVENKKLIVIPCPAWRLRVLIIEYWAEPWYTNCCGKNRVT
jgi:hypothetical protein